MAEKVTKDQEVLEKEEKKERKLERFKNTNEYTKENIVKKEQDQRFAASASGEKRKIIEEVVYKNGVKKRKLVGLVKDGKLITDRGVDKKRFGLK